MSTLNTKSDDQEQDAKTATKGKIEILCGPMYSGKTEELIRRVRHAKIGNQRVQVFKSSRDDRYSTHHIVSHSKQKIDAQPVNTPKDILEQILPGTVTIAVDEIQFFDESIIPVCQSLVDQGVRVILAGLDMDFRGEPFRMIGYLLAIADEITKLDSVCTVCGGKATKSQRLIDNHPAHYDDPTYVVGAGEKYEPRCKDHHEMPNMPANDLSLNNATITINVQNAKALGLDSSIVLQYLYDRDGNEVYIDDIIDATPLTRKSVVRALEELAGQGLITLAEDWGEKTNGKVLYSVKRGLMDQFKKTWRAYGSPPAIFNGMANRTKFEYAWVAWLEKNGERG